MSAFLLFKEDFKMANAIKIIGILAFTLALFVMTKDYDTLMFAFLILLFTRNS